MSYGASNGGSDSSESYYVKYGSNPLLLNALNKYAEATERYGNNYGLYELNKSKLIKLASSIPTAGIIDADIKQKKIEDLVQKVSSLSFGSPNSISELYGNINSFTSDPF